MKRKIAVVFVSVFLLSTMFRIQFIVPVDASTTRHPAQSIWVDPEFIDDLQKYDMFTIDVMINITDPDGPGYAHGLHGWDYKLKWNSTVLELTSYTISIPANWTNYFIPANKISKIDEDTCEHWLAVSAIGPHLPVTGVRSLCTYNFRVIYQPYYPEPDYNGTLDLQDTKLGDDWGNPIPHDTYDGEYRIPTKPVPIPGDVNGDGIVDLFDVVIASLAFGSRPGDPNWNPDADVYQDGVIDIFDLVTIGVNYGKRLPL